jgi:Transglycosylase SLT domain
MVTSMVSVITVTGAAIGAMVYYRSATSTADPLAMVVAQVATGKSGELLIKERENIILDDAATQSFTVTSSPKVTSPPPPPQSDDTGGGSGTTGDVSSAPPPPPTSPGTAESIAQSLMPSYGFGSDQWSCLYSLWEQESGWDDTAENASGAYGIPQALPGSKMASAGPDWETDPTTQIKWGLGYIQSVYGTPCSAWDHEEADGWY